MDENINLNLKHGMAVNDAEIDWVVACHDGRLAMTANGLLTGIMIQHDMFGPEGKGSRVYWHLGKDIATEENVDMIHLKHKAINYWRKWLFGIIDGIPESPEVYYVEAVKYGTRVIFYFIVRQNTPSEDESLWTLSVADEKGRQVSVISRIYETCEEAQAACELMAGGHHLKEAVNAWYSRDVERTSEVSYLAGEGTNLEGKWHFGVFPTE